MSPKSRGRPPGRNRRAWAAPPGNGTYRELDLELLNPDDEDERSFLLEAQHPELETALARIARTGCGGWTNCPATGRRRRNSACA